MRLTNNLNLPEAFVNAVANDPYSKGSSDYSITELLKPPRQIRLTEWFQDQVSEDVQDRLWALMGQMMHVVLERANVEDIAERRLGIVVSGKKVSGQIDSLSLIKETLTDYKLTTSFKFKRGKGPDEDFISQLNMQREILLQNGLGPINHLRILACLRDWNRFNIRLFDDYPEQNIQYQTIPIWPRERTVAFIEERISLHEIAKAAQNQDQLPLCSPSERWEKPTTWAVVSPKTKKAIKFGVCFSEAEAQKKCDLNPGTQVEFRQGKSPRCDDYCAVSQFCQQYQKTIKKG